MMEIYLDNSATTKAFSEVAEVVAKTMLEEYGNPSSAHMKGVLAEKYVINAKKQIASALKASEKEIYFTSGGTESDNTALIGASLANCRTGKHVITTQIEHPAILNTVKYLETQGFEIDYLSVDEMGVISLSELESKLRDDTILVSIMHTNNEVGSVQPIFEAGELIKKKNPKTLFHVDAVQGFGKAEIIPKKMNIDMMSISGHKIHGPKGIGILYVNEKVKIKPITYGGGQQNGMRSGTLNVPGIAGMGVAVSKVTKSLNETRERLFELKEYFLNEASKIDRVVINGCREKEQNVYAVRDTAPHIMNISIMGVRSEVMLHALEERGIYVSAGSACASHSRKESGTLKSMGADAQRMDGALRISMSEFTTKEELTELLKALSELIPFYSRFTRK